MPVKTACRPLLSNYPSLYSVSMVFPEQLAARSVAQPLVTQTLPSRRCQGLPAATPLKAGAMTGCCRGGWECPLIQSTRHTAGNDTRMYRGALYVSEVIKSGRYILGSSPGLPETIFRSLASHPAPPAIPPPPPPLPFSSQGNSMAPWSPRVFILSSLCCVLLQQVTSAQVTWNTCGLSRYTRGQHLDQLSRCFCCLASVSFL